MIRVIIVDDEPLAQEIIETYVQQMPNLELVAICNNALEANEILKTESIDLMFLDIQMPQLSGIEFLKTLSHPPKVIFTTAHADYAIQGFELDAVDYLLKPISFERFFKAVNKASSLVAPRKQSETENGNGDSNDAFIFVKADKKLVKINFEDILYIEGLKDYVIIRQETGRVITLQTMKSLEDKLPITKFKRIHRSYIVNIKRITAILGNMVELIESGKVKQLPIGKNYRDELMDIITDNKL
ncbi:MAG: LytTR family DNA-binding domain-containing protein [Chitinophagales bacterium]|nr:LytTR family DNA-binding domain-containing protein [Chitinophagales bacterium]